MQGLTEAARLAVGTLVPMPERIGSETATAQLARVPDRAKELAKELAELSAR